MSLTLLALAGVGILFAQAPPTAPVLKPSRYDAALGAGLEFALTGGAAPGARVPVKRFFFRVGGTQENRDSFLAAGSHLAAMETTTPGVAVIGVDLEPRTTNGLAFESAKTIVRIGGGEDGQLDSSAMHKCALAVDLVPLLDPTELRVGATLPIRVFFEGVAQKGVEIVGTAPGGRTQTAITDSVGSARIEIDRSGEWVVSVVATVTRPTAPETGMASYRGSLTFFIRGAR